MAPETAQESTMGCRFDPRDLVVRSIESSERGPLLKTPERLDGIIQHDPRVCSPLANQLG